MKEVRDVPMKAAYSSAEHSASKLAALLETLPQRVAIFSPSLAITHASPKFIDYYLREQATGSPSADDLLPPLRSSLLPLIMQVLESGASIHDEAFPLLDVHGLPGFAGLRITPVREGGQIEGALVMLSDPDGHTHEAIAAAELRMRRVLDNLFAFVGLLTPEGEILEANRAPLEAAGISIEEVRGKKVWDSFWFCHDPALQASMRGFVSAAARGETSRQDIVVRMKDDTRMRIDFMIAPLRDESGVITHLVPSAIDVTAREVSEAALRHSEELFRCVVEAAPDGLAMVDRDGRLALVNSGMERLFGYAREEMVGQPIEMLMPDRYRNAHVGLRSAYMLAPTTRDMAGRRELYARRKDGSEFPVEIGLNALTTAGGEHVLATIADVTKRKADQRMLEEALKEKTALLNEVHHRVKNNLQVVCSLLSLRARSAGPDARAVLDDSQNRVKAMSLIHQLLYERSDFSNVVLNIYLQRLASLLREAMGPARPRIALKLESDGEDIIMDLQRSVPCGLLVNELVTNAIKHAFPEDRHGTITLRTEVASANTARIIIADDGIGLPGNVELGHSTSLGLQLIPLLVDQLGGQLKLTRGNGTRFELEFARNNKGQAG